MADTINGTSSADIIDFTQTRLTLLPDRFTYLCTGAQMFCPAIGEGLKRAALQLWPSSGRVYGRDDRQGALVGDYLADHLADKEVAVLDDGTTWGTGVANSVRRRLRERGLRVAIDETFTRDQAEYSDLVSKMEAAGVDVFFVGGL